MTTFLGGFFDKVYPVERTGQEIGTDGLRVLTIRLECEVVVAVVVVGVVVLVVL